MDRAKAKLPSTAKEPIVQEQNANDFPIIQVNLIGEDVPERVVYNVAVQLRDDIEAIPEVLSAELNGNREEVLEALIDPTALESYQISNQQLLTNIVSNNRLIAAGALDTGQGRFAVKVPSVIERAQDIFDIPVKTDGDTVVTLRDVAQIRPTFKDRVSYARVNGKPAMSLNVSKRTNANVIDTVAKVRAVVEEARPHIPSHIEILYTQDQAPFAQQQVTELQGNIVTALALVMVLVVASMGVRSGIIVALSVPVSFLFALTTIYVIGYTYNFMVMFGLLLGLGLVVDGAIVVTEYADRKLVEGFDQTRRVFARCQADVLARRDVHRRDARGVPAIDVLARNLRQIHALSAGHRLRVARRFARLRGDHRTVPRGAVRQGRFDGSEDDGIVEGTRRGRPDPTARPDGRGMRASRSARCVLHRSRAC